ncbi:Peroxisome biosynthesis protein pex1 [Teratosphaeriaceae sp. CCFEE 6253]|nr:Peroxisome biosynthesis protein pex1 [Teratosphaeriaceae sp. CCFEE 6253]
MAGANPPRKAPPPSSSTTPPASAQAEIALLPSLKSCLVNLPASLVAVLQNADTLAQNVVVELSFRLPAPVPAGAVGGGDGKGKAAGVSKSVYVGWTGMQAQTRLAALVGREGVAGGSRGSGGGGSGGGAKHGQDVSVVEVDATFGRLVGLSEGMKVSIHLHLSPPESHTVHIEPLTPTDWEIIELHAHFLEMNFLSQIRALPNPAAGQAHPLTLHLTPTSTANVLVTALAPAPPGAPAFVKIAADAEVIVAPKTRASARRAEGAKDSRSVVSTSRRSEGGRSAKSTARHRGAHDEEHARPPVFLRGVTRALKCEYFDDDSDEMKDDGMRVWVDRESLIASRTLKGVTWVAVSLVWPAGLQEPVDVQSQPPPTAGALPATKVVAGLCAWDDAPDAQHVAVSSLLCGVLDAGGLVGGLVRLDPAPAALPKTASSLREHAQQAGKEAIVKRLRVTPFIASQAAGKKAGLRFGAESKAERAAGVERVKAIYGRSLLDGPLTEGMLLPAHADFPGGILDFDPTPPGDPSKTKVHWLSGGDRKLELSLQSETTRPKSPKPPGEPLPVIPPQLVGIDALLTRTRASLLHASSVLLTGGPGAGKTAVAHLLAHQLRSEHLFATFYLPCRALLPESTRVKAVKEQLHRLFATAAWAARPGARALVVLDDVDFLCPVETEMQGEGNGRSRVLAEAVCSVVREFAGRGTGVVLLATARGKEAVNGVVVGGHVVREIVGLEAPGKEGRRHMLQAFVGGHVGEPDEVLAGEVTDVNGDGMGSAWNQDSDDGRPASADGPSESLDGIPVDPELDLLDIAGQTDGYMPGDLALLVSRARRETLIRCLPSSLPPILTPADFTAALANFTPASLRGITLHASRTTFAAIGGLRDTRATLLETLQYPTTYAPLFARIPLRLRSGLLLYGHPGCGKTLLASAVAGECGLNFISVKGPEILNKYIGASEKSVRDLFARAQAARPAVLFFDEFDSIAPRRGHDSTGVTDRVVNMLLTMMDGAEGLQGVYVLAATSRPDLIDPALLRPGRLDKSLLCGMPSADDRLDILKAVSGKLHVDAAVLGDSGGRTLAEVAQRTEGYSGADLQAVMYNAHLEAIHDVLGSAADAATQDFGKRKAGSGGQASGGKSEQDFTYFRLGDVEGEVAGGATSLAAIAAERAQIAAKLSALQLARRKAKQERQGSQSTTRWPSSAAGQQHVSNGPANGEHEAEPAAVVISWRHLEKSLETTRSSISAQERARLEKIYREFVVGRNGEMSDGQGGTEVGGRSSLM